MASGMGRCAVYNAAKAAVAFCAGYATWKLIIKNRLKTCKNWYNDNLVAADPLGDG
jgi:hypothetical protein